MRAVARAHVLIIPFALVALFLPAAPVEVRGDGPKPVACWQVDDLRVGMKGYGQTVMKGTKIERFDVEVLGVMKNTSPGRDMVLCRLSGLNLESTGVIAGMSGSPVTIDGKLVGAVAFAWPFGKEPIAGVTPFAQMRGFVESYERQDLLEQPATKKVGLRMPVTVDGIRYDSVTVAQGFDGPEPTSADGLSMVPLQTPLAATGFTPYSLGVLKDNLRGTGVMPMQGGGASAAVAEAEKDTPLLPGGALAVAMIRGDFDLSGIGTVTHIEGDRVYGWGHPFMSIGACDLPLMTGYIHTIYPRQSVSFKMGSPLKTVGVINADVSTCIAGWLGRKPDMLPVRMIVARDPGGLSKTFNVEVARQKTMTGPLIFAALINSVDMQGELPEEMTAELSMKIDVEGHEPIILKDTYSGPSFSGGRAPQGLYTQVTSVVNLLLHNPYEPVRIQRVECETHILPGRKTADIEAIELDSEAYAPGETVKVNLFVRPYRGARQRLPVTLNLPADLPEGTYTATVCDDVTNTRQELRDNPNLGSPQDLKQIFEALKIMTEAKRTNLVVRVPLSNVGVALEGKSLPNLPGSMVQILGNSHRSGAQAMGGALVARHPTDWVFQGTESVRFTVTRNKKIIARD